MESIIVAIIGGCFSLAGIWLQNILSKGKGRKATEQSEEFSRVEKPSDGKVILKSRVFTGIILIFLGIAVFIIPAIVAAGPFQRSSYVFNFIGGVMFFGGCFFLVRCYKPSTINS